MEIMIRKKKKSFFGSYEISGYYDIMVAVRQGQPTLSHGVEATGILTIDLVAVDGDLLASSLLVLILQECSAFWISSGIPIVVNREFLKLLTTMCCFKNSPLHLKATKMIIHQPGKPL